MHVGDGGSVSGSTRDREVGFHGPPGNSTHDVNAELQTEAMYVVRQRLKPKPAGGGRKTVRSRDEPAISIHREVGVFAVSVRLRMLLRPLDIYHDVIPAVLLQPLRHV